jgi:dolichol-phosphate mannosyltransferase
MKTLIVIPTFNEKENITKIIAAIRDKAVQADILVVDDSSPDGTGQIVDVLTKSDKGLFVLHRKEKDGLGRAYVAGFKWGLKKGYKKLISMDADFSHPVSALPALIKRCDETTVAIGSRYIKGGKIVGWKWNRYLNSWGANFVTRVVLGISVKDATAGFKCYPAEFLSSVDLDKIQSGGYAFQPEMLLLAQINEFKLAETPITFIDRIAGKSKIQGELVRSAKVVFRLASQKKTTRQFVKFAIVGAINSGVDWGIFYGLKLILPGYLKSFNLQTIKQIAKGCSFIVAAFSSYIMNRKWTFRSQNKQVGKEALQFLVVATGGFVINSIVFYLVTALLQWRDIFGLIVATAAATLWNFFLNKKWTFKGL